MAREHNGTTIRLRVYQLLEPGTTGDPLSRIIDAIIVVLILTSIAIAIIESEPTLPIEVLRGLEWCESTILAFFIAEYVLRLWSCVEGGGRDQPVWSRLRFALGPMMLVDLVAIAPGLIALAGPDASAMVVLRALRLLRLVRIARYSRSMQLFGTVLRERTPELLVTGALAAVLMLLASTDMYLAERDAQPERFGSIPRAMWWAVVTLTTVGYGDVYPVTAAGRMLGAVVAIIGIGVVAVPTGILGAGFTEAIREDRKQRRRESDHEDPDAGTGKSRADD